ncbi:unnamed protein product, partial [Ectocarpus sp. 13 AM-2016]
MEGASGGGGHPGGFCRRHAGLSTSLPQPLLSPRSAVASSVAALSLSPTESTSSSSLAAAARSNTPAAQQQQQQQQQLSPPLLLQHQQQQLHRRKRSAPASTIS